MRRNLVVIMDEIAEIHIGKDTTFAMLLEGQRRGYRVWYLNEKDLLVRNSRVFVRARPVEVRDDPKDWFGLEAPVEWALGEDDLVLMRADPPVDSSYLYTTYLLDCARANGARVVNEPRALRDFNEKLAITRFPDLMPETLVSSDRARLREFVAERGKAVLKPLDGMGGRSIFVARADDPNLNVIAETLTEGNRLAMAQAWLPEIEHGDKRVLLIDGRPVDYLLARIPGGDDFRGNLARGGRGEGRRLGAVERAIAEAVGPVLVEHGIAFAGLDVIGDRLTEINVTSPTCVRELDACFGINIIGDLFDAIDP